MACVCSRMHIHNNRWHQQGFLCISNDYTSMPWMHSFHANVWSLVYHYHALLPICFASTPRKLSCMSPFQHGRRWTVARKHTDSSSEFWFVHNTGTSSEYKSKSKSIVITMYIGYFHPEIDIVQTRIKYFWERSWWCIVWVLLPGG